MPECVFHPGRETNIRCAECDRPICTQDMVLTPVGYKCKECARPARGQYTYVKPRQLLLGALWAFVVALGGGLILGVAGIGFFFVQLAYGVAVGEAARRGSGGHRSASIAAVAGVAALVGAFVGALGPIAWILAPAAAVIYVLGNRW